ncbi:putative endonuclease [Gracilimonas mengyeensis]|uniref:Putative endonuclease n=2 Tax=Gracilimonas mengyeensis TaxID=1302730 RepID=A0A521DJJ2_9BACT|nr:putative endonuclease [Gracilimonas mengyeensis]
MIKSKSSGRHYYGHTSDIRERIKSHNSTQNRYTRGKEPWKLLGYKECETKAEAMKAEQKLKSMKNPNRAFQWLKKNGSVR